MLRVGVIGVGKMGLSHLSVLRAHPDVEVGGVADSSGYVLDVLGKYTGIPTFGDYRKMLETASLDAVLVATPTKMHAPMVRDALEHGLHVFCEKPLCLTSADSADLADLADRKGLVSQVGYHNRFVGAFREVRKLLDAGAIGRITHLLVEAYGPVVLKAKGSTWRSRKEEGGGCLYDYAAHPIDLMTWYAGAPSGVAGTVLGSVFSQETDDEVFSTVYFPGGTSGQVSVNWSDQSYRKMTTQVTIWGTAGRIRADRQECQAYLRETATVPPGYEPGWNAKYTTELTEPVGFYLRGEEYSAQIDYFVERARSNRPGGLNSFGSALVTDQVLELMTRDAATGPRTLAADLPRRSDGLATTAGAPSVTKRRFLARRG